MLAVMCLIVAVGVNAPFDEVFEAFRHSFGVSVAGNPALKRVFPASMTPYWVTRGGCSCDLSRHEHKEDADHMRRRLQKKGWSANTVGPLPTLEEALVRVPAMGP